MLLRRIHLLFYCVVFSVTSFSQIKGSVPKRIGHTSDYEKIYSAKEIKILDSIIADFEKKTTIQIAIVTIDTSMVDEKDMENWTLKVLNTWGVGQKDKNNGILVGISKGYRHMRIENGYGIESVLTDQETKQIIDADFIPYFKEAKYFEGTLNGLKALMKKLE